MISGVYMKHDKPISCLLYLLTTLCIATSCTHESARSWKRYLPAIGTYSSPRAADLNGDGVLDIVMGAGGQEEHHTDTALIALDGATGELLWSLPADNQYVGSAVFRDISKDGVPDVFIGGRWAQLTAINGADGKVIWSFFPERTRPDASDGGWYNFTTPQFVPDQDGDGLEDLLIANGGNPKALPGDPDRPAGMLLVLSSSSGKILAKTPVPDGRETYMSVVCFKAKEDSNLAVLFGTGGETIGGHLYRTTLKQIMQGDLSGATVLATGERKGFVASPVLADITNDGIFDVIANAVDGKMLAINGANDSLLWQIEWKGTEAYTMPAAGYFNADPVPDFFANFAIGVFPNLPRSIRFMVDGKTGKVAYQDTVPAFQYASPVAADFNGDGFDDALVNQSAVRRKQFENVYYSYLLVFDFKNNQRYSIGDTLKATNIASTPWIGDLNGDNKMDIVYSAVQYQGVRFDLQKPYGLFVSGYQTGIPVKRSITWGAYQGSDYTGIFRFNGKKAVHTAD